jgi:hypothetical protein
MATKNENEILKNLPPSAADFLKLIIKNMRYRKSIRQDVMIELAAHFEDQLKDCKTEQEKEQKAKQLIEQFGDPKMLGVLLRRAKKRCRPLWRTVVVRAFQTAGVFILCLIAYVIWFVSGKPVITTDYVAEFNRLVRPAADETQNAFPLYEKAIQLMKGNSDYNDVKGLLGKKYEEANSVEKGKIEKFITANKGDFDLVIAGSGKPYYWRTYQNKDPNSGMMGILMPGLADFRKLAWRLVWRAQLSAEQGHFEDAFKDLTACYHFGQQIRQGNKVLIEQLVGIAIEALSVQGIRSILDAQKIDSAVLEALQQDMEKAIANENFTVNFIAEKLFMYDEIQRCFTDGTFGSHLYIPRINSLGSEEESDYFWPKVFIAPFVYPKKTFHILFTHPGKKETRQMADRLYSYYDNIAHKTPAQVHLEGVDIDTEFKKITKGNLLLEIMAPALVRVIEVSYRNKIGIQAMVAIIALQRYKDDKGQYPDSIEELQTTGYLKQLPIDPWSDKPLVYRKTDTGFTLYSVGLNFTDDGGTLAKDEEGKIQMWSEKEGDAVFWPVAK